MRDVLGVAVLSLMVVACDYQRPADVLERFDAPVGSRCGDGIIFDTEECDDGNAIDGDGCDGNCTSTRCGNGKVTAGEECDNGNAINDDSCDSNCRISCGNGVRAGVEACDDGNLTCGTCNATCSMFAEGRASGTIVVVRSSLILDGETFTLNDGINPPVTFEFDKDGTSTTSNVRIDISSIFSTTSAMATAVHDAIAVAAANTAPPLDITAHSTSGTMVFCGTSVLLFAVISPYSKLWLTMSSALLV